MPEDVFVTNRGSLVGLLDLLVGEEGGGLYTACSPKKQQYIATLEDCLPGLRILTKAVADKTEWDVLDTHV